MYDPNRNTGGDVSDDNELDLHELIDLSDSSDDDGVSFVRLPLPSPPPSPSSPPTQDEAAVRAASLPEPNVETNMNSQAETEAREDDAESVDSENGGDETVDDDVAARGFVIRSPGNRGKTVVNKVDQAGADGRKMARCSGTRGRGRVRGRGRGRPATGSRGTTNAAATEEDIDRATTPPISESFTRSPATTPSSRSTGRPRGSTNARSPPSDKTATPSSTSPTPSPADDAILTPPTSPICASERSSEAVVRSEDGDCDVGGVKTPPLTPTPSPSSRKRKATLSSLLSGPTTKDASMRPAPEGASPSTPGKKRRVDEVPDQGHEGGCSNVMVLLPSPTKRKARAAKAKPAHWTSEEMMLLFHEIYPRNYSADWNVVARIVGREPSECEAKLPMLINDLEKFLNKFPRI